MAVSKADSGVIKMARGTADLRYDQLLQVASNIIEQDGFEALTHANIATIAGCTRPLVYRYFPKKSDIYRAITADYYRGYEEEFKGESDIVGVFTDDEKGLRFLEGVWSVIDKKGIAALLLRDTPSLSEDFRQYMQKTKEEYEYLWLQQIEALGISSQDSALLIDSFISCVKHIAILYKQKKLTREKAIKLSIAETKALVAAFIACSEK